MRVIICVCSVNYLLLEALDTYAVVCDDVMTTSRDQSLTLSAAAADIRRRLADIFLLDSRNERPLHGGQSVCLSLLHCTALHNVPSWLCYC